MQLSGFEKNSILYIIVTEMQDPKINNNNWFIKKLIQGKKNSSLHRALALHVSELGLISGIPYVPTDPSESTLECRRNTE